MNAWPYKFPKTSQRRATWHMPLMPFNFRSEIKDQREWSVHSQAGRSTIKQHLWKLTQSEKANSLTKSANNCAASEDVSHVEKSVPCHETALAGRELQSPPLKPAKC